MPQWQQHAARAVHGVLYALLIAIPLSGWLYSSASGVPTVYLGLWQLPDLVDRGKALADTLRGVHRALNWTLAALVALHVAAALKHHIVDRDGLLQRMLPRRR
jgi:cytochrome b561